MQDENTEASSSETTTGSSTAYAQENPHKKNHVKLITFFVGVILVAALTFAGMSLFMNQAVKRADKKTPVAIAAPKPGTIESVDALVASDVTDETSSSDTSSEDIMNTITGSLSETQSLEGAYDGF